MRHPLPWWHPQRFAERRAQLEARARIATALRAYFAREGFVEVETPALQVSPGLEPHLFAFETKLRAPGEPGEGVSLTPGGTPLGGVPLRLTALDGTGRPFGLPRTRRAEADGSFRFTGLAAGDYRLMRLFASDETPFSELQQRVRLAPEGTTRVTLRAAGRAVVEGRLVITKGRLPPRLLVRAVRPPGSEGNDADLAHGALVLDGLFRFEGLAPGRWDFHATIFGDDRQRNATLSLDLAEGEQRSVELVFGE